MKAACHRERSISKRAIEYIQDIVTALLVEQSELPHFHFNEALLKPFENLLNTKTCDIDVKVSVNICILKKILIGFFHRIKLLHVCMKLLRPIVMK